MSVPLFSVVIPAYNAEAYLADAVASVLAQTCGDWECLVVDDGSTDGTGALADRLASGDARLRVIHQPNAGLGGARNAGVSESRGKWILYLDADDVYHPQTLARLADMVRDDLDFVEFRSVHRATHPDFSKDPEGSGSLREVTVGETLTFEALGSLTVWNVAWRGDVVRPIRFSRWISEDTLYRVEVACCERRHAFLDLTLHWYRAVGGALFQSGLTPAKVDSQLNSYLDIVARLEKSGRPIAPRLRFKIANAIVCRVPELLFGTWGGISSEGRSVLATWRGAERKVRGFLPTGLRLMSRLDGLLRLPLLIFLIRILPYRCVRCAHEALNFVRGKRGLW